MQVLKFGGTSVANAENIQKVSAIVQEKLKKDKTIVVVSALGGIPADTAPVPKSPLSAGSLWFAKPEASQCIG